MNTSGVPPATAVKAQDVRVSDRALVVELRDGRVVSVPLTWYPRLAEASRRERKRWELLGPGIGIHWPELDEDISVERPSRRCAVRRECDIAERMAHRSEEFVWSGA